MTHRVILRLILLASATLLIHAVGMAIAGPPDTETSPTRALPPDQAAAGFRVPPGFRVKVFAAEPDVQNPIAMAWDPRGRLWVAENYTYAELPTKFDLRLRDRVLIFEDTDGDGRFDKRTVFTDDVQMLTSVELGLGGVWLMCPPQLLFIPDRDGDDVPDGPAEVVLDGFTVAGRELPHLRQRPALGARRLALRPLRGLVARAGRHARHARRRAHPDPRRHLALSSPAQACSRCSPTARPTPGATTGTSSARCSSSTPSTATSGT